MRLLQIAELLAGVIPTTVLFTPFLLLLTQALAIETVAGIAHGRGVSEEWTGFGTLLLGPVGILALVSLVVLILRGPEYVARRRGLTLLVVGSGLPALLAALYFLWVQVVDPRARAVGGGLLTVLPLAATTLVGLRYLPFLLLVFPRPPVPVRRGRPKAVPARATGRSGRTRPSGSRPASRSGRSRARPSQQKPA